MKKLIFALFGISFSMIAFAQTQPTLEVSLSSGNLPTQRIRPGTENVEVLRIWLTATNHEEEGITLRKLRFQHEGDDRDHFLRYILLQENKVLGREALADSDIIEFGNLNVWLADGKTTELRILADVAMGEIHGEHIFSVLLPGFLTLEKNDFRDAETWIGGDFPVKANKIIIGVDFSSPPEECNLREEPVCGEDGKTYFNLCIPFQKGVKIAYEGECYQQDVMPLAPCAELFEPVCGDDGWTYANICELSRKKISKKHDGSCFPKDFTRPQDFASAVELFDLKKNELEQIRPRLSDSAQERLERVSFVLHQYNFMPEARETLTTELADFLDFTQNLSDRNRLEQEIELLNAAVIEARTQSAELKFAQGKIPFLDVDEDVWFLAPVQFLRARGWATGYMDENGEETGLFRPEELVTKAEITDLIFDVIGTGKSVAFEPENPHAVGHWAHDVIAVAEELGLSLWSDQPNPEKKVERRAVLKMIFELLDLDIPSVPTHPAFTDVALNDPDFNMIHEAKALHLISGYPDKTFKPDEMILRAEAAKIAKTVFDLFRK